MPSSKPNIALLIDADNAPALSIDSIFSELAKHGSANIRRAYGNWTKPDLKSWKACLHKYAIHPVQQFDYTTGKNATDAALIIDAMDLLHTQKLDAFAIVSSDCDFTPLVMRALTDGLKVYGFGEKKTPSPFVYACSTFSYLKSVEQTERGKTLKSQTAERKTRKELRQDTKLVNILRSAVKTKKECDKGAKLSAIGDYMRKHGSCDSRHYGYAKLSGLIEAIDLFEVGRHQKCIYVKEAKKS